MDEHQCPRRGEMPPSWKFSTEHDTWEQRDGQLCCSFCGSLAPELFMEAVEAGRSVVPTDKSYKAYIYLSRPGDDRSPVMHKFYYRHLSQSQMMRFVDLLNDKTMNLGEPGHFYVLPFFIRRG